MKNAQEIFGKGLNLVQHPHCRKRERTCAWQIDLNKYLSMSRATVEGWCQNQEKELGAACPNYWTLCLEGGPGPTVLLSPCCRMGCLNMFSRRALVMQGKHQINFIYSFGRTILCLPHQLNMGVEGVEVWPGGPIYLDDHQFHTVARRKEIP